MNESIADAANAQVLPQDAPANICFKRSTVATLIIASFVVAIMLWLPFRPSLFCIRKIASISLERCKGSILPNHDLSGLRTRAVMRCAA